MMRPLYIEGDKPTRVEWDAPALKVCVQGYAEQWFPLSRVSRILVQGQIDFATDALLACAEQGVSVVFFVDGEIKARCLGVGESRQAVLQRLADLLTHSEGIELYANWYQAMERMVVRSVGRKLGLNTLEMTTPYVKHVLAELDGEVALTGVQSIL